jgi:hypothetical protein
MDSGNQAWGESSVMGKPKDAVSKRDRKFYWDALDRLTIAAIA